MTRGYLLETNVVSEIYKPQPNEKVISFLDRQSSFALFASVLTLGEMRKGIAKKRQASISAAEGLERWIDEWEKSYADRILPVNSAIVRIWGDLHRGRSLPVIDSLLAATALAHRLTLVTRNTGDVADLGVELLNPWLE